LALCGFEFKQFHNPPSHTRKIFPLSLKTFRHFPIDSQQIHFTLRGVKTNKELTQELHSQALNKGLTMHEVLQQANVTPKTWSNWAKGRTLNPSPLLLAEVRRVIETAKRVRPENQRRQGRRVSK